MIYPDLRITDLEDQTRLAGERFQIQKDRTIDAARETLHPAHLLTHHKGSLIGAIVSFLLLGKLFVSTTKFVAPKLKGSALWGLFEAGWMWKALQLSYKLYKFTSDRKKIS